jgi:hypothetical protein
MSSDEQLIERIASAMRWEVEPVSPSVAVLDQVLGAVVRPGRRFARARAAVPALAGLLAVAIAITAVATLNHRPARQAGARVSPSVRGFAAALAQSDREPIAPGLLRHFGVLRSPVFLAKNLTYAHLTARIERALIEPDNPYGLNLDAARFVPYPGAPTSAPDGLSGVWIVPGRAGLALLSDNFLDSGTWGLSGFESPSSGRVRLVTWYGDGSQTIVGLVPDGSRRVTAVLRSGRRVSARVVDNVYSIWVRPHAVALLVKNAAGRTVRIPFTGG